MFIDKKIEKRAIDKKVYFFSSIEIFYIQKGHFSRKTIKESIFILFHKKGAMKKNTLYFNTPLFTKTFLHHFLVAKKKYTTFSLKI
jgi:uncharacterized circularly permuted ATP-grasp superfamily protein